MGDIKNPFDFGTGSIDKDQWLRDIDAKQGDFISMYGSAANKHRTTLLRLAFQDLRLRIASGNMLNRTSDGLYQFSSALNREDKHMQEAYERALGFMGDLARGQINNIPEEPEKKKLTGASILDAFKKSLGPDGVYNKKAYWEGDNSVRRDRLINFLSDFQNNQLSNYLDFSSFTNLETVKSRIEKAIKDLKDGQDNSWNLSSLGFDEDWIVKPLELQLLSLKELILQEIADLEELEEVQRLKKELERKRNPVTGETLSLGVSNFTPWREAYKSYLDKQYPLSQTSALVAPWNPSYTPTHTNTLSDLRVFRALQAADFSTYLHGLGTNYKNLYKLDSAKLSNMLGQLVQSDIDDEQKLYLPYYDELTKYLTPLSNNNYLINGSYNKQNESFAIYNPSSNLIRELSIYDIPENERLNIMSLFKEGGKIEKLQGGRSIEQMYSMYNGSLNKPSLPSNYSLPSVKSDDSYEAPSISKADWVRLASIVPDIISLASAYGGPMGTAASGLTGLLSTLMNTGADFAEGNPGTAATTFITGGLADLSGLIPGYGTAAKIGKITRAIKPVSNFAGYVFGAMGAKQALNALDKLSKGEELNGKDWMDLANGFKSILFGGTSKVLGNKGRRADIDLQNKGVTHYDIDLKEGLKHRATKEEYELYLKNGTLKGIAEENLLKLPKIRAIVTREGLLDARSLMDLGLTNSITQSKFEKYLNKAGDEGYVLGKARSYSPSLFGKVKDLRAKRLEELRKVKKDDNIESTKPTLKLQEELEVVVPSTEELVVVNPTLRKVNKATLSNRVNKIKALRETRAKQLREQQNRSSRMAMQEEIPEASGYYTRLKLEADRQNLSQPYANLLEIPALEPFNRMVTDWNNPRIKAFENRYGRATRKHKIGGILYALRHGGIIKAVKGVKLSSNADTWYNDVFSGYGDAIINRLNSLQGNDRQLAVDWLNGMLESHSLMYKKAGNNFNAEASGDYTIHEYLTAYNQGNGFTTKPGGFNTLGIQPKYNIRYDFEGVTRNTGDNVRQNWGPDGYYSQITDDRRLLGRNIDGNDDWTPENLKIFNDRLGKLGYVLELDPKDNYYKINPLLNGSTNPNDDVLREMLKNAKPGDTGGSKKVGDRAEERQTKPEYKLKNPFDPTLLTVAGKTLLGLRGNRDIYSNLLSEMPQAPLRDPIDRKLAIVGWLEAIQNGLNELADLRNIQQRLQGSDLLANFATALETERTGRGIMDKSFNLDSGRLFETAGKSWNIDNEDTLYNAKVGDDNRRSIADRARMLAQIRAAWRSGDNNILMGALADTSNWIMKKYQREQDIVDKARELLLGSPEERAQSNLYETDAKYRLLMDKYQSGLTLTDDEKTYIRMEQAKALRNIRKSYSRDFYNTYHTPGFGGGFYATIAKDGTKLEVAKLKARSKDNDRYVTMIKDLRKSSYRRRRR